MIRANIIKTEGIKNQLIRYLRRRRHSNSIITVLIPGGKQRREMETCMGCIKELKGYFHG